MRIGILLLALFVLTMAPRVRAALPQAFFDEGSVLAPGSGGFLRSAHNEAVLAQVVKPYEAVLAPQEQRAVVPSLVDQTKVTASKVWAVLVPLSVFASLLLFMGATYAFIRTRQIRILTKKKYDKHDSRVQVAPVAQGKNVRKWEMVVEHANSEKENDWRQAIMEADIMLDELLEVQGYRGDTMGEKLKQVERSDFVSIDMAWEAHKVRNRIAHEGSNMQLNHREVRRIVSLYEKVFKEFHMI